MQKGLPRPREIVDGKSLPYPYSASEDYIGEIDDDRQIECQTLTACGVCGEKIAGDHVWIISIFKSSTNKHSERAVDGLAMHENCATMTMKFCPYMTKPDVKAKSRRITKKWYRSKYGLKSH